MRTADVISHLEKGAQQCLVRTAASRAKHAHAGYVSRVCKSCYFRPCHHTIGEYALLQVQKRLLLGCKALPNRVSTSIAAGKNRGSRDMYSQQTLCEARRAKFCDCMTFLQLPKYSLCVQQ